MPAAQLVLLGWAGRFGYDAFAASPEARDGGRTRSTAGRGASSTGSPSTGAVPLYPFGGPPLLPFQRWAARAEPISPSPLGLFIHPRFGLWHSYRGALAFSVSLKSELAARRAISLLQLRKPALPVGLPGRGL